MLRDGAPKTKRLMKSGKRDDVEGGKGQVGKKKNKLPKDVRLDHDRGTKEREFRYEASFLFRYIREGGSVANTPSYSL